jgi:hypothetical protein
MTERMKRIIRWVAYVIAVLAVLNLIRQPPMPHYGQRFQHSWTEPILAFVHFLSDPSAWAAYSGQNYQPHVYYSNTGGSGTGLGLGQNSGSFEMALPNNPDQALACASNYQVWTNNSANGSQDTNTQMIGIGVDHVQVDSGCPMWPYMGSHIFGPGTLSFGPTPSVPVFAPANAYGVVAEYRTDSITYGGQYACGGGGAINSISASGGNETINVSSTSGYAVNDLIQVTGSSVAADNSSPGATFKITSLVTNTSITFANASAATCSSSCGNVAFPWQEGPPPYTEPLGTDGNPPALTASVNRTSSGGGSPISWSILGQVICAPMLACPNFNGCGLWNVGAAGNPAFQ